MLTRLFKILLLLIVLVLAVIITADQLIKAKARGKTYISVKDIPANKTGILLGTAKYLAGGGQNPYYAYRVRAAKELLTYNKIRYIIVSGDNSTQYYNEPAMLRKDLITAGIDSNRIFMDYAGLRTFDSMIRLRDIFSQDSVTVISQEFHNQRAIYIASREGIHAIGYNAKDISRKLGWKVQAREKLARVKLFIDIITNKKPKYLGEKIDIPS
jgi:SanA protein